MYPQGQIESGSKTNPTALVATTLRWFPTARLAMALATAGFKVKAVCPAGHPIEKTGVADNQFVYSGLRPIDSFAAAIAAAQPDIVIPGDDLATRHLHELHRRLMEKGKPGDKTCEIIERSLGSPESFPVAYARMKFMEAAQQAGCRAPRTAAIEDIQALREWATDNGLPAVLKSDGSSGGVGVKVAHTISEIERAFHQLSSPPNWMRAAKRALVDRDTSLLLPCLQRRRPIVNAQAFVQGCEATSAVACWNGRVVAAIHFDVLRTAASKGHATVVRAIDDPEMSSMAEKMASRLKLSGLYGFDFMRESASGQVYLIEINPRTTQVGHLALGPGRDLPAALYGAVAGKEVEARPQVTENDTIALFPQEWIRDSASPYLRSAYHDVPWEAPDLVLECAHDYRKRKRWYLPKKRAADSLESVPGATGLLTDGASSSSWGSEESKPRF